MRNKLGKDASIQRNQPKSSCASAARSGFIVLAGLTATLLSCGKPQGGGGEPPKAPVVQELPEFFGLYINNKGKLVHLDNKTPEDKLTGLSPDVSLVLFAQGASASDVILTQPAELRSNWTFVKLFAKPLEKPGMLMLVPAEPLPVGMYAVVARGVLPTHVTFFVGSEKEVWAAEAELRGAALRGLKTLKGFDGTVWTNSLGMKFAPVPPTGVAFSIWETRVRDYEAFAAANNDSAEEKNPGFPQTSDHPVVNVSWNDAKAFCKWLTEKERASGVIGKDMVYRLPTDEEWSVAVGLPSEFEKTPEEKSQKIADVYPWGTQWPPPRGAGNYDDEDVDDFKETSPVGSFVANELGLFDLGGNVWEWCEDENRPGGGNRVLRGGSWRFINPPRQLLSSYRDYAPPDNRSSKSDFSSGNRYGYFGFRCVLVVSGG